MQTWAVITEQKTGSPAKAQKQSDRKAYPYRARAMAFAKGLFKGEPLLEVAKQGLRREGLSVHLEIKYACRLKSLWYAGRLHEVCDALTSTEKSAFAQDLLVGAIETHRRVWTLTLEMRPLGTYSKYGDCDFLYHLQALNDYLTSIGKIARDLLLTSKITSTKAQNLLAKMIAESNMAAYAIDVLQSGCLNSTYASSLLRERFSAALQIRSVG